MKTCIHSGAFFGLDDYKDGLQKVKKAGFDAIDYQNFTNTKNILYTMNDSEFVHYLTDIKNEAKKNDVEIFQLHGPWPTDDMSESGRKKAIEDFKKTIYGASILGCSYVVAHTCYPFGWNNGGDKELTYQANLERFRGLLETCHQYGVTVCVENLPFLNDEISTVDSVIKLVDEINDPFIQVCLDTGHANIFKDSLYEDVKKIGNRLKVIHVHDNRGDIDNHLFPFQGTADFIHFTDALREIDFKGVMNIETGVTKRYPSPLREEMEKMVYNTARYLADRVENIDTERLLLRRFRMEDAHAMFTNWASDPEVTKFLTWNPHQDVEITKQIISNWLNEYRNGNKYRYAIEVKETNELIGCIDVVSYSSDGAPLVGYCIGKKWWNKGYMTEAFGKVVQILFNDGIKQIRIEAASENIGSNRVIVKNGFVKVGEKLLTKKNFKEETFTINEYKLDCRDYETMSKND